MSGRGDGLAAGHQAPPRAHVSLRQFLEEIPENPDDLGDDDVFGDDDPNLGDDDVFEDDDTSFGDSDGDVFDDDDQNPNLIPINPNILDPNINPWGFPDHGPNAIVEHLIDENFDAEQFVEQPDLLHVDDEQYLIPDGEAPGRGQAEGQGDVGGGDEPPDGEEEIPNDEDEVLEEAQLLGVDMPEDWPRCTRCIEALDDIFAIRL